MMLPVRIRLSNTISSIFVAALLFTTVRTQAINPDKVDFTGVAIWPDLKNCLKYCFHWGAGYGIAYEFGCSTNACLCRADTLGAAVPKISKMALDGCSAIQDQISATSILKSYCSVRSYTSIIEPTILAATGSCTARTSYITQSYFYTVTVYRNDGYMPQASFFGHKFEIALGLLAATTAAAMTLL